MSRLRFIAYPKIAITFFLALGLVSNVSADFIGYNVSSSTALQEGYMSLILEGVPLLVDVVTGFHVTFAESKCPIKLQIWRRKSYMNYLIRFEKHYQTLRAGHVYIPLAESDQIITRTDDRLGFSSLDAKSSCVAFKVANDPRNYSKTLYHAYSTGVAPEMGSLYTFDNYKYNIILGMGVDLKYGASRNQRIVFDETKVLGYNVSTSTTASLGRATIILEGLMLTEGQVTGYYVTLPVPNCPIRLQIWRHETGRYYTLLAETDFESTETGHFHVPSTNTLEVTGSDRLGFTTLHTGSTCVPYLFVSDKNRRSQTLFSAFFTGNAPLQNKTYSFNPLQTTFLFALSVEVTEAKLVIPGPSGVAGNIGQAGPDGPQGIVGEKGLVGEQGQTGEQGPVGDGGREGMQGIRGKPGRPGSGGDKGLGGEQGLPGREGQAGSQGQTGDKGPVGQPGVKGPQGHEGEKGLGGAQGAVGHTGESVTGDWGDVGPRGPPGERGRQGEAGNAGPSGLEGVRGPVGANGSEGVQGSMWSPSDLCQYPDVQCEHICESNGLVAMCLCNPGYYLVEGYRCLDVDECMDRNGLCQQDCVNTVGSFHCECPPGLTLSLDKHRCNDVDECTANTAACDAGEICINQWGEYFCVADPEEPSYMDALTDTIIGMPLLTRQVMIGLIIWLSLLTLMCIMAVVLFIPEISDGSRRRAKGHMTPRNPRPEFYYPAFFPRITLDRRASTDKVDMLESTTPRRMSVDEQNVAQEELYARVSRTESTAFDAETERKTNL